MQLIVVAVGQRMPGWIEDGWNEYARRLPADAGLQLRELRAEPRNTGKNAAQCMAAEATRIQAAVPADALRIALDERGRDLDTASLATQLGQWRDEQRTVALIIGGPDGLDASLKQQAHARWRLSSLTLPHPLVRVVVAEQLYRAWSILAGHPYHRA